MRTRNALINSLTGLFAQLVIAVLSFVNRSVFIGALGGEYLGVTGLFSNILTMLSLSELGIGTAIVFHLYKAVADKDQDRINALMSFYSRVFRLLALVITGLGLACLPFLQLIITKTDMDMGFLRVVFLLYIAESAANYLLSYRTSILFANQKDYITRLIMSLGTILGTGAQIAVLRIAPHYMPQKDAYILYLTVYIGMAILKNVLCFIAAKKLYPQVRVGRQYKLDADTLRDIKTRVKAMFVHKFSSVITNATDNLIITRFISLLAVGVYSNYATVINMVNQLFAQLVGGLQAGIGNLMTEKDDEKTYQVFSRIYFSCFWLYGVVFCGLFVLFNPFIMLWIKNEEYLLDIPVILVLCVNFYIIGVRGAVLMTRDAGGLFVYDWQAPVIKSVVNLGVSIWLAIKIGLLGVFVGTLVSSLISDVVLTPRALYKHLFKRGFGDYLRKYALYALVTGISTAASWFAVAAIPALCANTLLTFLVKGVICMCISNGLILLLFHRTDECRYFLSLVGKARDKVLGKLRKGRKVA